MEVVNVIVLFFLEIMIISIETEDAVQGSHRIRTVLLILRKILDNTGLRISRFCCN